MTTPAHPLPVIVVGAGLSGLACAHRLHTAGLPVLVLEAGDDVGGRVRTDVVDGFHLDRGFQVLLTAYPHARALFDYGALALRSFVPGALVRVDDGFARVVDPTRRPADALQGLLAPVGTLADKVTVTSVRADVMRGSVDQLFTAPEHTTREALQRYGFSDTMLQRFFTPFLGGVMLDASLSASSRTFRFVFRMFASGDTAVPAAGMQALPRQLAATLPAGVVRLDTPVGHVRADGVRTGDGAWHEAAAVVVATEARASAALLGLPAPPPGRGVTSLYFDAPASPHGEPLLVLDGTGAGPINNLVVMSDVSAALAPAGRALVSVTVLGADGDRLSWSGAEDDVSRGVRRQLAEWYGETGASWRLLRTYRIPHALPDDTPPTVVPTDRPVRVSRGLYACGDHRHHGSIDGALAAGLRAAEAVLADR